MTVIQAAHYGETEERLTHDPIIIAMAMGLRDIPRKELAHDSGTPRHEFMLAANAQYCERGGTDGGHLGAVPKALLMLLGRDEFAPIKVVTYFASRDSLTAWRDEDRAMAHATIISGEPDLAVAKQALVDYITKEVGYKIKNGSTSRVDDMLAMIPDIYAAQFDGIDDWESVAFDTDPEGLRFKLVRTSREA